MIIRTIDKFRYPSDHIYEVQSYAVDCYPIKRLTWPGPGALLILAPPCSSWTRVSRGTTMRSRLNPLGLTYQFVLDGNLTIARFLVAKLYCHYHFTQFPIICVIMLMCGFVPLYLHVSTDPVPCLQLLRVALIIMLAEVMYICWILEQPMGSADTLPFHPRMDWLFNEVIYEPSLKSLYVI